MSYNWALAGIVERPLYLDEERYMSHFPFGNDRKVLLDHVDPGVFTVIGERKPFLDGRFQIARCSSSNIKLARTMTVAFDDDGWIAISSRGLLQTIPKYRGQGIGVELLAEHYMIDPSVAIRRQINPRSEMEAHTVSGEATVRKTFHLMVKRGAVVPVLGDNSWHMERIARK